MTNDTITATITIPAAAEAVFGVLADPTTHAAIDGTGWVRESLDGKSLTGDGQQGGRVRPPPRHCLAAGPGRRRRRDAFIRRLDLALRHTRRGILEISGRAYLRLVGGAARTP